MVGRRGSLRFAAKVDANQPDLVEHLRARGATVLLLNRLGVDAPDCLVGFGGVDQLAEIKPPGEKLRLTQQEWHQRWHGRPVRTIRTREDAEQLLESLLTPVTL